MYVVAQAEARIAAALATNAAQLRERRAAFDARQTHNEERRRSARMTMLARCLKSHGQQAQRQALAYQLS